MLTLEQIREQMRDRRVRHVAKAIGVHHQTIYNLLSQGANPKHETMRKLSDYLRGAGA